MSRTVEYWRRRYEGGGTSGAGSRGPEAEAKARLLQAVILGLGGELGRLPRVVDLGAGDGYVIEQVQAPMAYFPYDPARGDVRFPEGPFDLALSLDVLHHLVDDAEYRLYLLGLFGPFTDRVLVWGSDREVPGTAPHVRHRRWSVDVPRAWRLVDHSPTPFLHKEWWLFERGRV